MQTNKQSVILLVGGKGTRLISLQKKEKKNPKALQKINSKVLVSHSMSNFVKYNYNNFVLPIGAYKDIFFNFFKNKRFFSGKKCKIFFLPKEYIRELKVGAVVPNFHLRARAYPGPGVRRRTWGSSHSL